MGRHQSAVVLTAPAVRHPFQRKVLCLYLLSVQHNARLDTVSRIVAAGRGQTQPRTPLIRIPEPHHTLPVPPLTAGYLTVLYMYAARILVSWELPTGWVSWLIVALMTVCIAIQFGLYPARLENNKRFDNWIARWMPY